MTSEVHWVNCPACGGASRYAVDNESRPFCSVRCKNLDLGAWASEQFRVPDEGFPELEPDAQHSSSH